MAATKKTTKKAKPPAKPKAKAKPAPKAAAKAKPASKAKPAPKATPAAKPATKPAAKPAGGAAIKLWADYWANPGDRELLRVYADALVDAGDPRGTFINLCLVDDPTPEQQAAKASMMKKDKKLLAGPGGAFLREFEFGRSGLVSQARTEAGQIIAGGEAMRTISPRLVLTVTSIKTLADAQAFANLNLDWLYFLDFGWITGTHGGMNLSDKLLTAIGPALRGVQRLQLSARGTPEKCFTPAGLRAIAPYVGNVRYLAIDYYSDGLPPAEEYVAAARQSFPALTHLDFEGQPGTGLLEGGRPSSETDAAIEQGREFADLLDAAIA